METTLILLKDGNNILISDELPKDNEGYWIYVGNNQPFKISKSNQPLGWFEKLWDKDCYKTVIAGYEDLPKLIYSDEVKKILKDKYGWVDVEELAKLRCPNDMAFENMFIRGFKEHQSISNKRFSLEEVLDAWELGAKEGLPLTKRKKDAL